MHRFEKAARSVNSEQAIYIINFFFWGGGVKLFIIMKVKERFLLYTFAYEREIVMVNNVWELTGK